MLEKVVQNFGLWILTQNDYYHKPQGNKRI
jgi:hypothetical protein